MDWFLYDNGPRHERINLAYKWDCAIKWLDIIQQKKNEINDNKISLKIFTSIKPDVYLLVILFAGNFWER